MELEIGGHCFAGLGVGGLGVEWFRYPELLYRGYIGIMENKMETTILYGAILGLYWGYIYVGCRVRWAEGLYIVFFLQPLVHSSSGSSVGRSVMLASH